LCCAPADHLRDTAYHNAARKRHCFLSALPLFVPSLSWQNDRFDIQLNGAYTVSLPGNRGEVIGRHSRDEHRLCWDADAVPSTGLQAAVPSVQY
jgi:hypothetical protein